MVDLHDKQSVGPSPLQVKQVLSQDIQVDPL